MLVLHDDAKREYAYCAAQGLPATEDGTLTPALYDEAKKHNWVVISMTNDWKHVFALESASSQSRRYEVQGKREEIRNHETHSA